MTNVTKMFEEAKTVKEFLEFQHATRADIFKVLGDDYAKATEYTDNPEVQAALIEAAASARHSTAMLQASQNQAEALNNIAEALNKLEYLGDAIKEGLERFRCIHS